MLDFTFPIMQFNGAGVQEGRGLAHSSVTEREIDRRIRDAVLLLALRLQS